MLEKLYILWVWALGSTLAGTLIFGLVNFPADTITQHMIDHVEYRVLLTTCVVLQVIQWFWCIWSKKDQDREFALYAYVFLTAMLVSWIALSNILTTELHIVFVYIFLACLLIFILIMTQIVLHETAVYVLYVSLVIMVSSSIAMICLYTNSVFYIPEHIAFFAYDFVFTAFFTVHTYQYWDHSKIVKNSLEMYSRDWEAQDNATDPCLEDEEPEGTFFMGRVGVVWIPTFPG